jgi:hypothetical protein
MITNYDPSQDSTNQQQSFATIYFNKETEGSSNGVRAFITLGEFLQEDNWYPTQLEGKYIYRMGFVGKNGQSTCYAQVRDDLEQFIFYAICPIKVPQEMRSAIAEFITRANYGLRVGNFEMDYSDGEIRYKSSIDFENNLLTPAFIRNAIYPAVQTMDRYLPGIMRVVYAGQAPEKAVDEVEG